MTTKIKLFLVILGLTTVLCGYGPVLAASLPEQAEETARAFFELLDRREFEATYRLLAPEFQKDTTPEKWSLRLKTEREMLGTIESRRLSRVDNVKTFNDLPEGEYLIAVYDTQSRRQSESREILALTRSSGQYGLAVYKTDYNKWPEAGRIIINGLFLVFFIMSLLAGITVLMSKIIQRLAELKEKTG